MKKVVDQNIYCRFESQLVKRSIESSNPINKIEKICRLFTELPLRGAADILGKQLNIWRTNY